MAKGRHKRTPDETEADLLLVSQRLTEGRTHWEIANELNGIRPYRLSRQQLDYDVKKLQARWRSESVQNLGKLKAKSLRNLMMQKRALYEAWHRSRQDVEAPPVNGDELGGKGVGGKRGKNGPTQEGQCGDPAFMKLILEVEDRIAKLLGLYAPSKAELTGAAGAPLVPAHPIIIMESNGFESAGAPTSAAPKAPTPAANVVTTPTPDASGATPATPVVETAKAAP
jgi:hypothetical protein